MAKSKATQARSRRTQTPHPLDVHADFGPAMQRDRSGRWGSVGAARVVLEDRDDIDHELNAAARRPVVRGARRWCATAALAADGVITVRQAKAADRFLDDLSRAQGATQASFAGIVASMGSAPLGITEGQRRAIRAVERVRLMLGLTRWTVFWWVVIDNKTVAEYAEAHRMRASQPYDWLRNDLDQLDGFYNPVTASPRQRIYAEVSAA